MYSFEFHHKLRKCNSLLYVSDASVSVVSGEWKAQCLYLRRRAESERMGSELLSRADSDVRKRIEDEESGQRDEFVCAVPANWVPEFPVFHQLNGKILARGWRGIVLELVRRGLVTMDKARSVFGSSLGETDYDRMTFDEKRFLMKRDQKQGKRNA